MPKLTVSCEEFDELLDGAEEIDHGNWRHGHSTRYLVKRDGKHYAVWLQVHHEDGVQTGRTVTLDEVRAVEKVITVWESVDG